MRAAITLGLVVTTVVTASCSEGSTKPSEPAPESSTHASSKGKPSATASIAAATVPPSTACDTLDRSECLSAKHCTLHWVENMKYDCRVAKGPCEVDLGQRDKPTCEKRDGCVWDPGGCYCPFPGYGSTKVPDKNKNSGSACGCGGGPPPICKKG